MYNKMFMFQDSWRFAESTICGDVGKDYEALKHYPRWPDPDADAVAAMNGIRATKAIHKLAMN